jgi:hypothetical protein
VAPPPAAAGAVETRRSRISSTSGSEHEENGMNATQTGLLAGLVLGIAGAFGGFDAFLIVLVLGGLGLLVGRVLDGHLDLNALLGRGRDR